MAIQALGQARNGMRRLFRPLSIAASGLAAQTRRIETIAQNLANVETTRTPEGGPYRRQVVQFRAAQDVLQPFSVGGGNQAGSLQFQDLLRPDGVRVVGVSVDTSEGEVAYLPGHPDADAAGYVEFPNVTIEEEFTDLMDARRAFEANATVFQVAKAVLRRALEI